MLIEPTGTNLLNAERRRRLASSDLRRKQSIDLRVALATLLVALAKRLAPEVPDRAVLRARAAPNT